MTGPPRDLRAFISNLGPAHHFIICGTGPSSDGPKRDFRGPGRLVIGLNRYWARGDVDCLIIQDPLHERPAWDAWRPVVARIPTLMKAPAPPEAWGFKPIESPGPVTNPDGLIQDGTVGSIAVNLAIRLAGPRAKIGFWGVDFVGRSGVDESRRSKEMNRTCRCIILAKELRPDILFVKHNKTSRLNLEYEELRR